MTSVNWGIEHDDVRIWNSQIFSNGELQSWQICQNMAQDEISIDSNQTMLVQKWCDVSL